MKQAGDEATTIATSLDDACAQFNKLDPFISQLAETSEKVSEASYFAGELHGVFKPLQWMLENVSCVGDQNNIKHKSMNAFLLLTSELHAYITD